MWSCSSRSWARRACRFFCSRCCIRPSIGHGAGDPWVRPLVAWLVSAFLFGMLHLPTYRWNFLQCLVIFFSLFLGFAAFVATRSWTILFLSHFLYDLLSRPLVLNACRHAALLWLLVAVACVYWHFGKGSASRPASPPAPPISADCRVDGMPRPAGSPAVA
ncbi:CPBP family intramembrane glutamic endopeptidase [Bifidobacterium longum]|uniref:CPBP family intramembrane glutamic endopeptidase n=1 Tax=Bifidobacterium longum TaxID=216816 RepID=UPI0012FEDBB7